MILLGTWAFLEIGCSGTMLQNPTVMEAGEVRLAGGGHTLGMVETSVSVGVGKGLEVQGFGGVIVPLPLGFKAGGGVGYGRLLGDEFALKVSSSAMFESYTSLFDFPCEERCPQASQQASYVRSKTSGFSSSTSFLLVHRVPKQGTDLVNYWGSYIHWYAGPQINVLSLKRTLRCRASSEDLGDDPECPAWDVVGLQRRPGVMVGMVVGMLWWQSRDKNVGLQGEVIGRMPLFHRDLYYEPDPEFLTGGLPFQASLAVVWHFNKSPPPPLPPSPPPAPILPDFPKRGLPSFPKRGLPTFPTQRDDRALLYL